jgi:hypothetical protein
MRSFKVFISGRVTGLPRADAVRNFERGKKMLLQNGYDFINPVDLVPEGADQGEAMTILCPLLTAKACDAILLLNDSKFSEGSQIEEMLARYCGKQIFYEDDLTQ